MLVVDVADKSAGTAGGCAHVDTCFVVTVPGALSSDVPAVSVAVTVKRYCVAGARCRAVNVVDSTTPIGTPFWETVYLFTVHPAGRGAGFQLNCVEVLVVEKVETPVGAPGTAWQFAALPKRLPDREGARRLVGVVGFMRLDAFVGDAVEGDDFVYFIIHAGLPRGRVLRFRDARHEKQRCCQEA